MLQPHSNTEESRRTRPWCRRRDSTCDLLQNQETFLWSAHGWRLNAAFHCFSCYNWICRTFKVSVQNKMKENMFDKLLDGGFRPLHFKMLRSKVMFNHWVTLVFCWYWSSVIKVGEAAGERQLIVLKHPHFAGISRPGDETPESPSYLYNTGFLASTGHVGTSPVHGGSIMEHTGPFVSVLLCLAPGLWWWIHWIL